MNLKRVSYQGYIYEDEEINITKYHGYIQDEANVKKYQENIKKYQEKIARRIKKNQENITQNTGSDDEIRTQCF